MQTVGFLHPPPSMYCLAHGFKFVINMLEKVSRELHWISFSCPKFMTLELTKFCTSCTGNIPTQTELQAQHRSKDSKSPLQIYSFELKEICVGWNCKRYVPINLKPQHSPPPGIPPGIWFFWFSAVKFPSLGPQNLFKCPTCEVKQTVKCPTPGAIFLVTEVKTKIDQIDCAFTVDRGSTEWGKWCLPCESNERSRELF